MDLPAELERFVPDWETLLLNLHRTPPESLTRFATAMGWALRVLQEEKAPLAEMERVLREAMAGLEGLTQEQSGQWLRVAWFLLQFAIHRREEEQLVDVVLEQARTSKFRERERVTRMGRTVAEQWKAEGEAMGAERTMRSALLTILVTRFGALQPETERALAAANMETMEVWLRRAANAATLDEVGIRLPETTS